MIAHPFFSPVDWKRILRKEIEPPFKPHLSGAIDVTYFDPTCTEAPVGSAVDIRASPVNNTDPEDCFASFSFVAPQEFGSTPHSHRKPTPLSVHAGSFHSSSPLSQYSPHTPPAFAHPLAGLGIPRSPATFSLASMGAHSPHSRPHSPHSNSPHSPHALSIIASSSPRGTFSMGESTASSDPFEGYAPSHPMLHPMQGLVHAASTSNLQAPPNHALAYSTGAVHESARPHSLEAPTRSVHGLAHSTGPPTLVLPPGADEEVPPLPSSHSNPNLNLTTGDQPRGPKSHRPTLWTSASTPNLFAQRDAEEEERVKAVIRAHEEREREKREKGGKAGNGTNKKTFKAIMSSVFRKMK